MHAVTIVRIILFWLALAIVLLDSSEILGRRRSAQSTSDAQVEFAPTWAVVVAMLFLGVDLVYSGVRWFLYHREFWGFISALATCMGGILVLSVIPGTIVSNSEGLRQVFWFSRNKRVSWNDIVEINVDKNRKTYTITGRDGTQILHAYGLPDRQRFLIELRQHCGENLPPEFPSA